jgi:anti-sigma regulatory factor (Ser/Thr protein kinase)
VSRFARTAVARSAFADGVLFDVEGGPTAPSAVRALVAEWLAEQAPGARVETARLLVSEIVSNAVEHGGAGSDVEIETLVRVATDVVYVEVSHPGHGFAKSELGVAGPDDVRGRGLRVVGDLAERWDVLARDGRCSVWFELRRDGRPE